MNNNRFMSSSSAQATQIDLGLRSYMLGVYNHMTTALALTGLMAMGLNFLAISNGALTPIGELFFLYLCWFNGIIFIFIIAYLYWRVSSTSFFRYSGGLCSIVYLRLHD